MLVAIVDDPHTSCLEMQNDHWYIVHSLIQLHQIKVCRVGHLVSHVSQQEIHGKEPVRGARAWEE